MAKVSIKLKKTVQFAEGGTLRSVVQQEYGPTVKRGGLALQAEEMRATPRVSGHLQRGWTTGSPEFQGKRFAVRVGNNIIYLRRVDRTSVQNQGFLAKGYNAGRPRALAVLRAGVKELLPKLMKAGKT